jgi:uncharacterized protein
MHLLIDGYNLLHVGRSLVRMSATDLQRERDELIGQLAAYRRMKSCEITVVFDGWQGGWISEKRERRMGMEIIFSRLGERADEVIKRLVKEKGSGVVVITSDREVARFSEKLSVTTIPSAQFKERLEISPVKAEKDAEDYDKDEEERSKKKGPARRLSKKEKRARAALRKL